MTRSPELGTAVRCPSTSLYWAVLDASMLPRRPGSPSGRQLGYLFEEVLPVPIESVHAVYLPLHGQHYLACGADEALVRAAHDNGALALVPTELPPFVVESAAASGVGGTVDVDRLNLLTGAFEPHAVGRARRRWLAHVAIAALSVAVLVFVGQWRRATAIDQAARGLAEDRLADLRTALPAGQQSAANPELALLAELRQLEQTRTAPPAAMRERSAATILAEVMRLWPRSVTARPDSASVSSNAIVLRGTAATSDDAQRLADAFRDLEGWTLEQPQFRAGAEGASFTVTLRPAGEAAP
ncbi:MAG: hypothetical protein KDA22_04215 [Phycisphaerales bacterium]|nr:hypothetical protein [Phycisphaerales bacterium]